MNEFVLRALAGGGALALIAGPVGALMLWRKMAFFGATIAEGAVLGVVSGLLVGAPPLAGATIACLGMAFIIEWQRQGGRLADDTVIGVIGHAALAAALVAAVYLVRVRVDFLGYLFGDILAITWNDVYSSWIGAGIVLLLLVPVWRPLILATAEPEIAAAEGVRVKFLSLVFALLLAGVVALGLRMVGALLIVALLIMPAAAARPFCRTPVQMALLAILIAGASIAIGIFISFQTDWPTGPTVALAAAAIFFATTLRKR
jgi:zinc transport system permease protein